MKVNKGLLHHHINCNTGTVNKNKYDRYLDNVVYKNLEEQSKDRNIRNSVNDAVNVSVGKESDLYPKIYSNGDNQSIPRSKDPCVYIIKDKNG